MSHLSSQPLIIPEGVKAEITDGTFKVSGPRGELTRVFRKEIDIKIENDSIILKIVKESVLTKALIGTYSSHIRNMIYGVLTGYEKKLIIEGVGYRASVEGNMLVLSVGFSHQVKLEIPSDLAVTVEKNVITVNGIDKEKVGSFSSKIRIVKKPEPYKGKGIRYDGEIVKRKQGKKAVT